MEDIPLATVQLCEYVCQTWETFIVRPVEQSSILSAKFDCPVARQNLSRLATAHDCETDNSGIIWRLTRVVLLQHAETTKCIEKRFNWQTNLLVGSFVADEESAPQNLQSSRSEQSLSSILMTREHGGAVVQGCDSKTS